MFLGVSKSKIPMSCRRASLAGCPGTTRSLRSNRFDITDFEALNYPKIIKNKKVGLFILIIVQDGKKFRYALTEWSDFIISPKYNPHERRKTKIKMKNLTPFEKLLIFSNDV